MEKLVTESVGKSGGRIFSDGTGYWYRVKEKRSNIRWRLFCHHKMCKGTASLSHPNSVDGKKEIKHNEPHSCEPNVRVPEVYMLRQKMLKRSREEVTNLSSIFHEESTRRDVDPEVACRVSFASMESTMYKARRKDGCPPIPQNIWDYIDAVKSNAQTFDNVCEETFLSGVVGEGDDIAVVFVIKQMQNVLMESDELHVDGTFKCVPKKPKFKQLFTIMAIYQGYAFPVVFCLMSKRTADLYEQIFSHLKEQFPNLSPDRIVGDYEYGIKAAVSASFPTTKLVGCWFHFAQSIYRQVQKLGLATLFRTNSVLNKATRMIIALALLPHDKVDEGMTCVENYYQIQQTPGIAQSDSLKIEKLFRYVKNYWIGKVGSRSFSVHGQINRTNNCQESFHKRLNGIVGGNAHPNIWTFQRSLVNIARETISDFLRLENDIVGVIRRNRKTKWLLQDQKIKEAERKLMADPPTLTIYQFISSMAYRCTVLHPRGGGSDDEEEDDDENM